MIGVVFSLIPEKEYGFIKTEEKNIFFVYRDSTFKPTMNDRVEFDLKEIGSGAVKAVNIRRTT